MNIETPKRCNLILHCGASKASREEVAAIETPASTSTWTPIPHVRLVRQVESALDSVGLKVGGVAHSLSHGGSRYFGLMEVQNQELTNDYSWVLGLRNSHDKRFPAGIVAGASVFVCDNLSFSGEIKLARKHTRYIDRDLPCLVTQAIGKLLNCWHHQDQRINSYRNKMLKPANAHDIIIRAFDVGVCGNQMVPDILHEWRHPRHEAFRDRSVWSLFNAFTEVLKGNLTLLPKRTTALHAILDAYVGLN